jgi:hypothetical protein
MKKIFALTIVLCLTFSTLTLTFALNEPWYTEFVKTIKVEKDDLYPDTKWMNESYVEKRLKSYMEDSKLKGYLSPNESQVLNNILDEYIKMFWESSNHVYETENSVPENYKDGIAKSLHRSNPTGSDYRMFKNGKQIFICYSINQIESAIDLMTYGLIGEKDRVLDLNGVPTMADGVIMAVKLAGGEKEALEGKIQSPYVDAPEYAKAYIAYANKVGILNPVPQGSNWDDSQLTFEKYTSMLLRALGYEVVETSTDSYAITEKYAFSRLPSMDARFGTYYDSPSACNRPQYGEPLRNGDLVSLVDAALYENIKGMDKRAIDRLVEKNIVSKDLKKYMAGKDYFQKYSDAFWLPQADVSEYTKLIDGYQKEYPGIIFYSRGKQNYEMSLSGANEDKIGYMSINTYYKSLDEASDIYKELLVSLGASESKANGFVSSVLNNPSKSSDKKELIIDNIIIKSYYVDYNNIVVIEIFKK